MARKYNSPELAEKERMQRDAVASGNVDKNSVLYRHAKLQGWNLGNGGGSAGSGGGGAEEVSGGAIEHQAGGDWISAQNDLKRMEEARTAQYGQKMFDDFSNLVMAGKQKRADFRKMQDATLSSMMLMARQGDGFVPPDILGAASRNMGFEVAGGNYDKQGNFYLYGVQRGKDGSRQIVPMAIATPQMQFKTFDRAKMGLDERRRMYAEMARKLTPEQLSGAGIRNPNEAVSSGGKTVPSSWLGYGRRQASSVGSFSADGKGNFRETRQNADGSRFVEERNADGTGRATYTDPANGETRSEEFGRETERERIAAADRDMKRELARERNATDERIAEARADGRNMSPERMQLEYDRLAQRQAEEDGRNARSDGRRGERNARLAASVAKNMGDIKRGLRLDDRQAASFQSSLTKILSDAFDGGSGNGGEENPAERQEDARAQFKKGDEKEINGVRMRLLPGKKDPGKLTWQRI